MRKIIFFFTLLFLIIATSIYADEKPVRLKDDPRLQEKIQLDVRCEPLSYFCQLLADKTGAKIRVKRDIQDQNVTAFAKEITPHEAMRQVALLYGYYWEVGGDPGKHSYTLYRPIKRVREAEELRNTEIADKERKFRDFIEEGIKLADSSPADIQKAFNADLYRTADMMMFRENFRDLGCFSGSQRNNLWDMIANTPNGEVQIPFRQLPPSLQGRLRKSADDAHAKYPDYNPGSNGIDDRSLIIARGGGYGQPRISGLPLQSRLSFFGLTGMGGSAGLGNSLSGRKYPLDSYELKYLQDAGVDTSSYKAPDMKSYEDAVAPESKSERVPIKFEGETDEKNRRRIHTFTEILKTFSEAYDKPVFTDDYLCRRKNNRSYRSTFPKDYNEAVNEIEHEFDYASVSNDEYMRFRNNVWYNDEPFEVPKRLIEKWIPIKKEKGDLDFFDLLDIVAPLTNLQLEGLMNVTGKDGDQPFLWEVMRMAEHIDRMRFCSTLSASQMAIAFDTGLPMQTMTYNQQQYFAFLLHDARPALTDDDLWNCKFKIGNLTTTKDVSLEELQKSGEGDIGAPIRHTESFIVFTYIYGADNEQAFNFMLKHHNEIIK